MKSIDYGSTVRGGSLWPYNSYNLTQLRGPSDFMCLCGLRRISCMSCRSGRARPILSHGVAGAVIGGWQVGGILTAYNGLPMNGPNWATRPAWALWVIRAITRESVRSRRIATSNHWWNAAAFDCTSANLTYHAGNKAGMRFMGSGRGR